MYSSLATPFVSTGRLCIMDLWTGVCMTFSSLLAWFVWCGITSHNSLDGYLKQLSFLLIGCTYIPYKDFRARGFSLVSDNTLLCFYSHGRYYEYTYREVLPCLTNNANFSQLMTPTAAMKKRWQAHLECALYFFVLPRRPLSHGQSFFMMAIKNISSRQH